MSSAETSLGSCNRNRCFDNYVPFRDLSVIHDGLVQDSCGKKLDKIWFDNTLSEKVTRAESSIWEMLMITVPRGRSRLLSPHPRLLTRQALYRMAETNINPRLFSNFRDFHKESDDAVTKEDANKNMMKHHEWLFDWPLTREFWVTAAPECEKRSYVCIFEYKIVQTLPSLFSKSPSVYALSTLGLIHN